MQEEFPGRVPFTIQELQENKQYIEDLHRACVHFQPLKEVAEKHGKTLEEVQIDIERLGETFGTMAMEEIREFLDLERYDLDTAHQEARKRLREHVEAMEALLPHVYREIAEDCSPTELEGLAVFYRELATRVEEGPAKEAVSQLVAILEQVLQEGGGTKVQDIDWTSLPEV